MSPRKKRARARGSFFDEALEKEKEIAFKETLCREYGFWALVKALWNNIIRSLKRKGLGA